MRGVGVSSVQAEEAAGKARQGPTSGKAGKGRKSGCYSPARLHNALAKLAPHLKVSLRVRSCDRQRSDPLASQMLTRSCSAVHARRRSKFVSGLYVYARPASCEELQAQWQGSWQGWNA